MSDLVPIPEGRLIPMQLEQWGIVIPFVAVKTDDGIRPELFIAVKRMCGEIGIGYENQLEKLLADEHGYVGSGILQQMLLPTPGGNQRTWVLRKPEAALWIGQINSNRVKSAVRGQLDQVRQDLLQAADKIVFGDLSSAVAISDRPARGGEVDVGPCPRCHTPLLVVVNHNGIFLKIADV